MFDGLEVTKISSPLADNLTWDFVKRLKDTTSMKVVLKGIVTSEDAALSLQHGAEREERIEDEDVADADVDVAEGARKRQHRERHDERRQMPRIAQPPAIAPSQFRHSP